jgi:hypothetical protein
MRVKVVPVYGTVMNLPAEARNLNASKFIIGFLLDVDRTKTDKNDQEFKFSQRSVLQRCLKVVMRSVNQYRLGFPFLLPGHNMISFIKPVIGTIHGDTVELRDIIGVHSYHSVHCGILSYIGGKTNFAFEEKKDDGTTIVQQVVPG